MAAVPPVLQPWTKANGVERQNAGSALAVANKLNAIGRATLCRHVWHKSGTHAPPAWFFAAPL